MKVLLLNPPAPGAVIRDYYCSKTTKSNYLFQPIDLLMQSGLLAMSHQVTAIDAVAKKMDPARCLAEIERSRPDAVLGLWGAATNTIDEIFYRELAARVPAPVFITGEVFLDDPEGWLSSRPYIKGALLRFVSVGLRDYLDAGVPGPDLVVREEGGFAGGLDPAPPREFRLARPLHELFGFSGYRFSFARGRRFATALTDFGCPFRCGFCVMSSLGHRLRELDEVVSEWEWLKGRGISELFVSDQCFGAARARTLELCGRLSSRVPGMGFTTFTRADLLDREMVAAFKSAGCHTLIMGVESAGVDTLETYHKHLAPDKVTEGFALCKERGIRSVATFIVGLPEDTEDSIRADMRLARELDPDFVSYNVAVPRAGTSLGRTAREECLSAPGVDPDQAGETVAMRTRALSREDVARLKRLAVRDFYLRPSYLVKRLFAARSLSALWAEAREGLALLRRNY